MFKISNSSSAAAVLAGCLILAAAAAAPAAAQIAVPEAWEDELRWRSIDRPTCPGRITDVNGLPSSSKTFYVAAAAGGIWKTTNNGQTCRTLFHDERVVSLGDSAIGSNDPDQIWAGIE